MTARIIGVIIGLGLIGALTPVVSTLWNLNAKIDAMQEVQHENVLALRRIERKLDDQIAAPD